MAASREEATNEASTVISTKKEAPSHPTTAAAPMDIRLGSPRRPTNPRSEPELDVDKSTETGQKNETADEETLDALLEGVGVHLGFQQTLPTVDVQEGSAEKSADDVKGSGEKPDIATDVKAAELLVHVKSSEPPVHHAFSPQSIKVDPAFSSGGLSDQDETTVDEMKIQTMYKMVEDVPVLAQGKEVVKKVLYLTNKQANLFDEVAMERCIQALELGEPKFIIMLLHSGGESLVKLAHEECIGTDICEYKGSTYQSSELDESDARTCESRIILFMRTCILPLARQTRAIILVSGANDCFLNAALANVVLAEQARLGKDCPFTVIATALEFEVHSRAASKKDNSSLASQIARGSLSWSKRMSTVNGFINNTTWKTLQRCDLTAAASRYIVFESFDEGPENTAKVNWGPSTNFQAVLIQCLTRKIPSIAIQGPNISYGVVFLNDLVSRNIPVLLLDSTERAISMRNQIGGDEPSTRLAKESLTFPSISRNRLEKMLVCDDTLSLTTRKELLVIALEMVERKWNCLIRDAVQDSQDCSLVSFMHSALLLGAELEGTDAGENVPLHIRIRDLERLQRTNKDSRQARIPPELIAEVIDFIETRNSALKHLAQLAKTERWLQHHSPSANHLLQAAETYRDSLKPICDKIQSDGGKHLVQLDSASWLGYYDLLTNPNTFSGSVHDIDGLKRILGSVAKIDRLPVANSLEVLRTLQDAWDHVEVYTSAI